MTEQDPGGVEISAESDPTDIPPLPVKIVSAEAETPAYGAWSTYSWPAATSISASAQRIAPLDERRHKGRIIVFSGAGAAAGAYVQVGARGQVMNNAGGQLQPGNYEINNRQELWLASDGTNAMIVTVLLERYE